MHPMRAAVPLVLAVWLVTGTARDVAAHGGSGPVLETFPTDARVGDTVTVFGDDLAPVGPVVVSLVTLAGEEEIARAETDADGHFTTSFVVPEHPEDVYEVRATDSTGQVAATYLLIGPAAEPSGFQFPFSVPTVLGLSAAVAVGLVLAFTLLRRRQRATRR
jgi:hypothetical protein